MILTTAGFLTTLGFIAWILGTLFDKTGIAVIGGVLVVGVGAMGMTDGYEQKVGETQIENSANETEIRYDYAPVETPTHLPLGVLVMLLGALLTLQSINDAGGS